MIDISWVTGYYNRQSRCELKLGARSSKIDQVFFALRSIATASYCSGLIGRSDTYSETPCSTLARPTFRDCAIRILMHIDLQPLSTQSTTIDHHRPL